VLFRLAGTSQEAKEKDYSFVSINVEKGFTLLAAAAPGRGDLQINYRHNKETCVV